LLKAEGGMASLLMAFLLKAEGGRPSYPPVVVVVGVDVGDVRP
jgi:hypothetical protein